MASGEETTHLSQAAFARRRGVSRKSVTEWKNKGLLVLSEAGLVDVEQSEWNLDQRPAKYRGGVTHRPIRSVPGNGAPAAGPCKGQGPPSIAGSSQQPASSGADDDGLDALDLDGSNLPLPEAIRRKENFLGLRRKQEYEQSGKALVDRAAAEKLFFDTARDFRDAWLSWPARIAVTMADELKIDARTLTTVLTAHVHQHLAELGEPHADFA